MTKQEIIDAVSKRTGIEKTASRAVVDETISVIRESLCSGESIYIRGLFTLAPVKRAEKIAQNIGKKQAIVLPAHYAPHAKFSNDLRRRMKKSLQVK